MGWGDVGNILKDAAENAVVPGSGELGALQQYGGGLSNLPLVGPAIGNMLNPNGAYNQYAAAMQAIISKIDQNWDVPDAAPLTPQEFQLLNQYSPQIAGFVQQQQPQLVPQNASNAGTQAQQQSLNQLGQLAQTGTDAGLNAQLQEAGMSADQRLRSNRANALQALANRGLGSSGATLSADIQAGLGASEQQRQMALEATAQAAQRKAQAIQGLGSLGTQVAGQQQQAGEFNANTLNQYNQLMTNRRQQYNDYVAGTQNQANMYNQQQAQNVANANTGLNNQYNMYNNEQKWRQAGMKNQKLMTEAGMQSGLAGSGYQNQQQQIQNSTGMLMSALGLGAAAASGNPALASAGAGYQANQGASSPKGQYGVNAFSPNSTGGGYVTDPDMGGATTGSAIA